MNAVSAAIRCALCAPCALCALAAAGLLATTAHAQTSVAAAQATGAARATNTGSDLGRLFFTPERRQQLDRQRELKIEEKPPAAAPTLTIDGVVTRSSGKRTVWINGTALNDGEQADGVAIGTNRRAPGQLVIRPGETTAIPARVGDTVNSATGEVGGSLGSGRIGSRPADSR